MDIRARRTALGWSRKELAEKAFVDPRTLQLIELGESKDDESIARLVKFLDEVEAKKPQG